MSAGRKPVADAVRRLARSNFNKTATAKGRRWSELNDVQKASCYERAAKEIAS